MSEQNLNAKTIGVFVASSLLSAVFGAIVYVTSNSEWHSAGQFVFAICYFGMFGLLHCAFVGLPLLMITRTRMAWSLPNLCLLGVLAVALPWGIFVGSDWMIFGRVNTLQAYLIVNLAGLGIVGGAIFWWLLKVTKALRLESGTPQ